MDKIIKIAPLAKKEDKLQDIADYLEEVKDVLAEAIIIY